MLHEQAAVLTVWHTSESLLIDVFKQVNSRHIVSESRPSPTYQTDFSSWIVVADARKEKKKSFQIYIQTIITYRQAAN